MYENPDFSKLSNREIMPSEEALPEPLPPIAILSEFLPKIEILAPF